LRRRALFWHYPHYSDGTTPYSAIRQQDFKLIDFAESGRCVLFNLTRDPREKEDLANKLPEMAQKLKKALAEWRKNVRAQMASRVADHR
jgi:hypothetical protein